MTGAGYVAERIWAPYQPQFGDALGDLGNPQAIAAMLAALVQ